MLTRLLTITLAGIACAFAAMPAYAQRDRVFVASYGSDSNPCSFTQPCRTFQAALGAVVAGGEISAIDSAGFGPVTINQSVTITSPNGVEAGIVAAAGGVAAEIDSGAVVILRGLTLEGASSATYGIVMHSGARLEIDNCVVRDFTTTGIYTDGGYVTLTHSIVTNNPTGVFLTTGTSNPITMTMDYDIFDMNTTAVNEQGTVTAPIFLTIANSDFSHNATAIYTSGTLPSGIAHASLYNVVVNNSNELINIFTGSIITLSHVNDMTPASGLYFNTANNISVSSDGTNHVTLSGPLDPGHLGAYPLQ
jgi:Right handed beta helix region